MSFRMLPRFPLHARVRLGVGQATLRGSTVRSNSTHAHTKEKLARYKTPLNAALAVALLGAGGGAYFYKSSGNASPNLASDSTFTVSRTLPNGERRHGTFEWLPDSVTAAMMHENEDSQVIDRPGNPVTRWDRNWVGSNEPSEDRSAIDLLPRVMGVNPSTGKVGEKDLMLFSVIDGHGGAATAALLEKIMNPALALGLTGLQAGILPDEGYMKRFAKDLNPMAWAGSMWTPENIMKTLRETVLQLDDSIVYTPFKYVAGLPKTSSAGSRHEDCTVHPHPAKHFITMTKPADHGAVALSMLVDAENDDIYVSSTGDCRAVAGWQHADGTWRCDALSEDKDGGNPKEVARPQAEHPAAERDTVIREGRVLGSLQPTRAFGDSIYKWTSRQVAELKEVFDREGEKIWGSHPGFSTPPYVTALPELEHRKLHGKQGEKLKFVIVATDGLWDMLSSEDATMLVAKYLQSAETTDIPKTDLPKQLGFVPPAEPRPYKADDRLGTGEQVPSAWVFEGDQNAATHLIRNAFGANDRKFHRQLLSMRGKDARTFRDDITVQVVFF